MVKLAVGARDVAELAAFQKARLQAGPRLVHQTRNMPKRAAEIIAGGSLYWVVAGAILVRQRITAITREQAADGSECTALVLHPELVRVAARPVKAFQGWRYLEPADAPPDLASAGQSGQEVLPEALRAALAELALL